MTFCRVILIKEVLVVEADANGDGGQAGSDLGEAGVPQSGGPV